ncbi:MAG: hypothetical protein GTO41_01990, partial [Burkholderiales bacterium]|nr:hypothetical protein [Burkholderiales bacterium]
GAAAGINFRFDEIKTQPNTVDAHQLILLAARFDVQNAVVESLFGGFFLEGCDIADRATLLELTERG